MNSPRHDHPKKKMKISKKLEVNITAFIKNSNLSILWKEREIFLNHSNFFFSGCLIVVKVACLILRNFLKAFGQARKKFSWRILYKNLFVCIINFLSNDMKKNSLLHWLFWKLIFWKFYFLDQINFHIKKIKALWSKFFILIKCTINSLTINLIEFNLIYF